jgi:voltage-gated potassium channel
MELLLDFLKTYLSRLLHLWPFLVLLVGIIAGLGLRIGRLEQWTPSNALYFAFITATAVGYGDFHPTKHRSKWLAITIALFGVLLTGLIVSIGLEAVSHAFREARGVTVPIGP